MHTLVIKVNGKLKYYLLNTKIKSELTDKIVNEIIDIHQPEDWYIEDGYLITQLPLLTP